MSVDESSSMDGSLMSSNQHDDSMSDDYRRDVEKILRDMEGDVDSSAEITLPFESIQHMLRDRGFDIPDLDYGAIARRLHDVRPVEVWMEAVLKALEEVFRRLDDHTQGVISAHHAVRQRDAHRETLERRIEELQSKLHVYQQNEREFALKLQLQDESTSSASKDVKKLEADYKKKIKNLETIIQEHERRARQREQEFEKLKKKLAAVAEKDSESTKRHKDVLHALNTRDISLLDQSFSELGISPNSSGMLNQSSGSANSRRATATNSTGRVNTSHLSTASTTARLTKEERIENLTLAVKVLENERRILEVKNADLERQVEHLGKELLRSGESHRAENTKNNTQKPSASKTMSTKTAKLVEKARRRTVDPDEEELDEEAELKRAGEDIEAVIAAQAHRIEELAHQLTVSKAMQGDAAQKIETLRKHLGESHAEIENLRVELDARPTVKQWNAAQRDIHDLEVKVHELVLLRGEAAEINAWRKHLSTAERIQIDKRNHALGLYMLESLPKNIMKESLQMVCRELDISDLSELQMAIQKLKSVVRAVPRMERFIAKVTAFVYDRTVLLHERLGQTIPESLAHETLEKTLSLLQKWWTLVQKCLDLDEFREAVLFELYRANELLTGGDDHPDETSLLQQKKNKELSMQQLKTYWEDHGRQDWLLRDPVTIVNKLRDMADLQVEILRSRQAVTAAETFVFERPDILVNRLVAHLQYLLEVKSLDGLLPQVNRLYIFNEEMRNFLNTLRSLLGLEKGTASAVITDQTLSAIAQWVRRQQTAQAR